MDKSMFVSHDGRSVALYVWDKVKNAKGVVKIAHGMAEHSARYDEFATYLNSRGYIVVMNDHRGHGLTAAKDSLGYEEGDMWGNNVADQLALIDHCQQKYGLPIVMMGHSYGSFVTQAVMENNPNIVGHILCGSNFMKGMSFTLCRIIAKSMCRNKGGRYPAQLLVNLSFKMYEKKFPGQNAWLNRDDNQVAQYNADPMCGYVCSANFYRTFMNGIKPLYKKDSYAQIDKQKPLLIVAGGDDPVGAYGKGIAKLDKFYTSKVGMTDVTTWLYSGARHEILNEPECKAQVFEDIANWLDEKIATR